MNPKAKTRNVDLVRNVLVKGLVRDYADLWLENQAPEVLHDVLGGATAYHVIALRLQIRMPKGERLVGAVVARAYREFLRSPKG